MMNKPRYRYSHKTKEWNEVKRDYKLGVISCYSQDKARIVDYVVVDDMTMREVDDS